MIIKDAKVKHDFIDGIIEGENVSKSQKLYVDAKGYYEGLDPTIPDETVMYEVYTYNEGDMNQSGNLQWGLSILKPVVVNQECNMTRGHFHENLDCAEFYFGLGGEGLLLLMVEDGTCYAERVCKNSLHHIDGKIAHRLINTGEVDLKVGACWPVNAGHDYKRIEDNPFKVRVKKENNEITIKEI